LSCAELAHLILFVVFWFQRGFGLVCDRDGTPGYQDPSPNFDTYCAFSPKATTDCILAGVANDWLLWNHSIVHINRPNGGQIVLLEIQSQDGSWTQKYVSSLVVLGGFL
jgi:hypothetical protein